MGDLFSACSELVKTANFSEVIFLPGSLDSRWGEVAIEWSQETALLLPRSLYWASLGDRRLHH